MKCKNLRGPWQEVQIDAHAWDEIDTPAFWAFLEKAVKGFARYSPTAPSRIRKTSCRGRSWAKNGISPAKVFRPANDREWDTDVLEELIEILSDVAPDGQFLWNNKATVRLMVREQREPWAVIWTKHLAMLELQLCSPKGKFAFGRATALGLATEMAADRNGSDVLKIRFRSLDDLASGDVAELLAEHLAVVRASGQGG